MLQPPARASSLANNANDGSTYLLKVSNLIQHVDAIVFRVNLGDVLRLLKRHPACRRREARLGSCTERENLHGKPPRTMSTWHDKKNPGAS
jgi:hypothetical protein